MTAPLPSWSAPIALAVGLAVCSGARAAPPPPTLAELDALPHTVNPVPGLRLRLPPSPDEPRTAPSPAKCVALWNASVPAATRRYLVAHAARRAVVALEENHAQQIGGTATWTNYACAFGVQTEPKKLVLAVAPPAGVSYPWRGWVDVYRSDETLKRLQPRLNAIVERNGALALR